MKRLIDKIPWGLIFFLLLITAIGLVSNDSFWAAIGGDPDECITRRCSDGQTRR